MLKPVLKLLGKAYYKLYPSIHKRRVNLQASKANTELEGKHLLNLQAHPNRATFLRQLPKEGVVVEIGVDKGDFTHEILKICKPKKLYIVDCWDFSRYGKAKEEFVRNRFKEQIKQGIVEIQKGFSTDVLPGFEDNSLDWVYIDTDHSYKTTAQELSICQRKVVEGGYIAGHDYTKGSWRNGIYYGVIEAVNEFCVLNNWEFLHMTLEGHGHYSFALKQLQRAIRTAET